MKILKNWLELERSIFSHWRMILNISKKDFIKEFAGTRLGLFWAVVRPLAQIIVFWVVFGMVFSSGPLDLMVHGKKQAVPYLVWLVAGYIPWMFISEYIVSGASSIRQNAFLVKKVKFPVEILPSIRLGVSFYNYLILVVINFVIMAANGWLGKINYLMVIYATIVTLVFLTALARLFATWVVMSPDFIHGIGVAMNFLFWLCPVMWGFHQLTEMTLVPQHYIHLIMTLIKVNPLTYLVLAYRDAYLGTSYIGWHYTVYFFIVTILLFMFSSKVFKKFRPEFDDVL